MSAGTPYSSWKARFHDSAPAPPVLMSVPSMSNRMASGRSMSVLPSQPRRPARIRRMARPQVVIVGGGFGGLACARRLQRAPVDVVLLDRRNYHLFTPLLYQVATALLNAADIAYPLRAIFRKVPNVHVRQVRVERVDTAAKRVHTSAGADLPYDYLVLATGSENNTFGNQSLAEHAIGLKTLEEALRLRNHVLACLERAEQTADDEERRRCLTFVVAGGGPTGVEYAGALHELLLLVLGRDYGELDPGLARILLVEGKDELLPGFHPRLGRYARQTLAGRGIEIRTGTLVDHATEDEVVLTGGETIPSRTLMWAAGVRPNDPTEGSAGVPHTHSKRVQVDDRLRVAGAPGVFVVGDLAGAVQDGQELPQVSPPAIQAGHYVARAIAADVLGRGEPKPFHYLDKGTMAAIGRGAAVVDLRGLRYAGVAGFVTWAFVHLGYLVGYRNRAVVLAGWFQYYLRRDRPIRIQIFVEPDRTALEVAGEPVPAAP
jgi:NADH dehydrogenase